MSQTPSQGPQRPVISTAPGDRLLLWLLIVLVVGTPTVFLRTSFSTFDIPQLTLLWVALLAITLVGAYRTLVTGRLDRGPTSLTVASAAFLGTLLLSTVLSAQPWVAATGLSVRGAGALTYGGCLLVLHVVYRLGKRRSVAPVIYSLVVAHGLVVLYAIVQSAGLDPFVWGQGELYVNPVFSTLGNPNFSAGYIGLTLPIVVWMAFGSEFSAVGRGSAGALVGAAAIALAHLGSFQGNVSALMALTVLGYWVLLRQGGRLGAAVIATPVAGVVAVVPLANTPSLGVSLGVLASVAGSAVVGYRWDQVNLPPGDGGIAMPSRRGVVLGALLAATGLLVVVARLGGKLVDELVSGLDQRTAFWQTAVSIFRSSPIIGTGLETYVSHFTAHRPLDHAVEWETVVSDSPHSVPLGLLSGGGVFLLLSYLMLTAVVLSFGVQAVRQSVGSSRLFYGAVLASWVAYHVQSSVSMDMPGLIHTQWVLGGALVARGAFSSVPDLRLPWGPARERGASARKLVAAAVAIAMFIGLLVPLTAPLRADLAVYRAQQALNRDDVQAAQSELERAVDLQPRHGFYVDGLAMVYGRVGLGDLEMALRRRSAQLQPGNPFAALEAGRLAAATGRPFEADRWFDSAVTIEPQGARVISESARHYALTGRAIRAYKLLETFEALRSPNTRAWQTVREIHEMLGNADQQERARLCATDGQNGCWP